MILRLSLDTPVDITYIRTTRLLSRCLLQDSSASRRAINDVEIIVAELCSNVIRHAQSQDPHFSVTLEYDKPQIVITVSDTGRGFSLQDVPLLAQLAMMITEKNAMAATDCRCSKRCRIKWNSRRLIRTALLCEWKKVFSTKPKRTQMRTPSHDTVGNGGVTVSKNDPVLRMTRLQRASQKPSNPVRSPHGLRFSN